MSSLLPGNHGGCWYLLIWLRTEMAQVSFSPGKPVLLRKSWVALKASAPSWNCLDMFKLHNTLWRLNSFSACQEGHRGVCCVANGPPGCPGLCSWCSNVQRWCLHGVTGSGRGAGSCLALRAGLSLMQILLVVKQDERDRSVERESAPDRIYIFFCLLPGRL